MRPRGRLAVELVPHGPDSLLKNAALVRDVLPEASVINVPDLLKMSTRSWDAATLLHGCGTETIIPHVRAIDVNPNAPLPGAEDPSLREVLIVGGDPPPDDTHPTWPNSSPDIITRYRRELPHLNVYAVFDPYRRAPRDELDDLQRKRDAGAAGFFTQPLFELPMLDLCMNWLAQDTVFWGISPVIGPKSRNYWERVNRVVFPRDFDPSLDANIALAQALLTRVTERGDSAYLMPLRVDLTAYLSPLHGIFS